MVPDTTIEDIDAHKAQAAARGYTVGHADLVDKWVLLCPQGNYRGSHDTEELAWRAAPRDRRCAIADNDVTVERRQA